MKYLKMEDINIESMELFHVNRNHYNSKIYYKQDIYTTIFNKPVELYNMFIKDSGYYYCDWSSSNMILIDNTISLIDLDSFWTIKKINNPYWNCKIKWYIEKVDEIAKLIE